MEDEIKKRSTDCVYFLASPLTCKKGSECEYRHCEHARLNPRDCWYWLSGNCLNPSCTFRHPPIEGLTETSSKRVPELPSAVSTGKGNAPCYFFFNSFCTKGDKCHFLHENDIYPPHKVPNTRKVCMTSQVQEKKVLAGTHAGPPLLDVPQTLKKMLREPIKENQSENVMSANAAENAEPVKATEESHESSMPRCDESPRRSADRDASAIEHITDMANSTPDQSADELEEGRVHSNEHWESSPGFDVLVDHDPEELIYENDADYHHAQEGEPGRLPSRLAEYNCEEFDGYDRFSYPDIRHSHDRRLHDCYCDFARGYDQDIHRIHESSSNYISNHSSNRVSRHRSGKQETAVRQYEAKRRDRLDLHQPLRKQRRMDHHHASNSNRRHHSDQFRDHGQGQLRRVNGISHARFSSDRGRNVIDPYRSRKGTGRNTDRRRDLIEYNDHNRLTSNRLSQRTIVFSRRESRTRRHALFLEYSESLDGNETNTRSTSVDFPAPKSLAQIKDEKKKAEESKLFDSNTRYLRSKVCTDFEGPKPLKELLKNKGKLDYNGDRFHVSALRLEENKAGNGGNNNDKFSRGHKRNFSDEEYCYYSNDDDDYDDDDDSFARRLSLLNS